MTNRLYPTYSAHTSLDMGNRLAIPRTLEEKFSLLQGILSDDLDKAQSMPNAKSKVAYAWEHKVWATRMLINGLRNVLSHDWLWQEYQPFDVLLEKKELLDKINRLKANVLYQQDAMKLHEALLEYRRFLRVGDLVYPVYLGTVLSKDLYRVSRIGVTWITATAAAAENRKVYTCSSNFENKDWSAFLPM